MAGLSVTVHAEAVSWSADQSFTADATFSDGVIITADITVTIAEGKTLTVNGGIDASGHTLTVAGKGKLSVNGKNEVNVPPTPISPNRSNGASGYIGGTGFKRVSHCQRRQGGGDWWPGWPGRRG